MNKKAIFIIVIIMLFVVALRFLIIPSLSKTNAAHSCAGTTLNQLIDNSNLIIVGRATEEEVKTKGIFNPFTYTIISEIEIMKGRLEAPTLQVKQAYGCDIVSGYCVMSSMTSKFELGNRYILFLQPSLKNTADDLSTPGIDDPSNNNPSPGIPYDVEQGVYIFSNCVGKYLLSDEIYAEQIKEIINSHNESRWVEFLQKLYGEVTQSGSPGQITQGEIVYP